MHERQKIPEEVLMRRVQFKAEPTDPCFAERSKRKKQNEAELTFALADATQKTDRVALTDKALARLLRQIVLGNNMTLD